MGLNQFQTEESKFKLHNEKTADVEWCNWFKTKYLKERKRIPFVNSSSYLSQFQIDFPIQSLSV